MVGVKLRMERRDGGDASDQWIDAIQGPRQGMEAVAEVVEDDLSERFGREADPWGDAWAPLSPATIKIAAKRGITPGERDQIRGSRFSSVLDGGRRASIGLRNKAARWFHEGNPQQRVFGRGRGPRPARRILPIRDGVVDLAGQLREDVMRAFREGMRRAVHGRR